MGIETSNPFSILPTDIFGSIVRLCDPWSLARLTQASSFFSHSISLAMKHDSVYTTAFCHKLLHSTNMALIDGYFPESESINPALKRKVELYGQQAVWSQIPTALERFQRRVTVQTLSFGLSLITPLLLRSLSACPDVQTVGFSRCNFTKFSHCAPGLFSNVEKLIFSQVNFNISEGGAPEHMSKIINSCKKLKHLAMYACSNAFFDFHNFTSEVCNRLEYFSEDVWAKDPENEEGFTSWENYVEMTARDVVRPFKASQETNAISCYYLGWRKLRGRQGILTHEHELEAAKLFRKSIEKNPRLVNVKLKLAELLSGMWIRECISDYEAETIQLFKDSIELLSDKPRPYIGLGRFLLSIESDPKNGLEMLQKAEKLAMKQNNISALFEIVEIQVVENTGLAVLTELLNYLFWEKLERRNIRRILHLDDTHVLAMFFEIFSKGSESYRDKCLDKITDECLRTNYLPGLLAIAYWKKDTGYFEQVKKVVTQDLQQDMEKVLPALMEKFFDIPSWISVLQLLDKSGQDIKPFFCFLAILMAQGHIAKADFLRLKDAFGSHSEWFQSKPYKKALQQVERCVPSPS
jgi:hypothetical protein